MQDQTMIAVVDKQQQARPSGVVATLESWHETYTRLNPWAHGGFIERVIQKMSRNADISTEPQSENRNSDILPAQATKLGRDSAPTPLRASTGAC